MYIVDRHDQLSSVFSRNPCSSVPCFIVAHCQQCQIQEILQISFSRVGGYDADKRLHRPQLDLEEKEAGPIGPSLVYKSMQAALIAVKQENFTTDYRRTGAGPRSAGVLVHATGHEMSIGRSHCIPAARYANPWSPEAECYVRQQTSDTRYQTEASKSLQSLIHPQGDICAINCKLKVMTKRSNAFFFIAEDQRKPSTTTAYRNLCSDGKIGEIWLCNKVVNHPNHCGLSCLKIWHGLWRKQIVCIQGSTSLCNCN